MKKFAAIIFGLSVAPLVAPAEAAITQLTVTPSALTVNATVGVEAQIPPPGPRRGLPDGLPPFQDIVSDNDVEVRITPRVLSVTWSMSCDTNTSVPTSARGEFRLNGQLIDTTGPLTAPPTCDAAGAQPPSTARETIILTQKVVDALIAEIVGGVSTDTLIGMNNMLSRTVTLEYARFWVDLDARRGGLEETVAITVNGRVNAELNRSRLVSASGQVFGAPPVVPLTRAGVTPVNVNWTTGVEVIGDGTDLTLESRNIVFRTPSGQQIGALAKPLTRQVLAGLTSVLFNESITVQSTLAARARQLDGGQILIERRFSDGESEFVASVPLSIGTAGSAGFQIFRMDLRFTDGARIKVVDPNAPLQALVDINYNGTGQLIGRWEWAPLPAAGTPFFRPLPPAPAQAVRPRDVDTASRETLTLVREFLVSLQNTQLRSPPLPTNQPGQFVVRLVVQEPEVLFEVPVIRYAVTGNAVTDMSIERRAFQAIGVRSPATGAELTDDLRFAWGAVPGDVTAYQIEFFADPTAQDRLTGIVVPGDQTSALVSRLARTHLPPGETYWWRVSAFARDGQVSAVSDPRTIVVPEAGP